MKHIIRLLYLLVFIAAISSSISLVEVIVTVLLDSAQLQGKTAHRGRVTLGVSLAILAEAALVAVDGLGNNGLWVPGQATFGISGWNNCWLDFMDFWSEGLAMPIGALLMAVMVAVEVKPKYVLEELHIGYSNKLDTFGNREGFSRKTSAYSYRKSEQAGNRLRKAYSKWHRT